MREFCSHRERRVDPSFALATASEVFAAVYERFFKLDYRKVPYEDPNLRDRFHMDAIGMSAIQDKYGIILVGHSEQHARLIMKDWTAGGRLSECHIPSGMVEEVGAQYIDWSRNLDPPPK